MRIILLCVNIVDMKIFPKNLIFFNLKFLLQGCDIPLKACLKNRLITSITLNINLQIAFFQSANYKMYFHLKNQ